MREVNVFLWRASSATLMTSKRSSKGWRLECVLLFGSLSLLSPLTPRPSKASIQIKPEIPKATLIAYYEIRKDFPASVSQNWILLSLIRYQLVSPGCVCINILKRQILQVCVAPTQVQKCHIISCRCFPSLSLFYRLAVSCFKGICNIFETNLLCCQQGAIPNPTATFRYSLNACDKLKMQWIMVSPYKTSVYAHFISSYVRTC